jgi:hypothetical protein
MFEIGASQQHRGQTRRHSEARKHQEEHVLVLVGDVDLRKVLRKRGLDLLLLDLITAVFGKVESGFAVLKRAGVSAGAWRGRACMCGPSPSLVLPRRTLLPRHSNTDACVCVCV